ncbi:DUF4169 family protein [Aurantimonas coralicida]|uniref:DUF4169 family protein n=1 Tax=Aurantimonas coralicida TaxID=182270 RepID=UPI001E304FED|nr:DUF4169 family protein [Aurantimonas coralicida]MCD1643256.1 DUF4169 family protein [Aurantimonas coralicida]
MADIVNLRTARKRKARADDARVADDNRVRHGTPKAVRQAAEAERSDAARKLDGLKRERLDDPDAGADEPSGDPA